LVDVPEGEVLTAGEIIEFITKIAVMPVCQEMDEEGYGAEENY
jgi:hypothetical protein